MATRTKETLVKFIRKLEHRHDRWTLWTDWLACTALALSQKTELRLDIRDLREVAYLKIAKKYTREELTQFAHAMGELAMGLDEAPHDILGDVFHELELNNKARGQFFTPTSLTETMASMLIDGDLDDKVDEKGFITVSDPCVGSGSMFIGFLKEFQKRGHTAKFMRAHGQDIDQRSIHMAFIQLALLRIPAVLVCGDTLKEPLCNNDIMGFSRREQTWYTPAWMANRAHFLVTATQKANAQCPQTQPTTP